MTTPTTMIHLKSPDEIAIMREAGRIVARALAAMRDAVKPGVTTLHLNQIAETVLRDHGATPTFLHYPKPNSPPFPAVITASINHELVHGIPSGSRFLKDGDIITVDVGCNYQGFVGDAAITVPVGEISKPVQRLLDATQAALDAAIQASRVGNDVRDVALAIQKCAESYGYSVAREYTGHGVGRQMHEPPEIPNWWPSNTRRSRIQFENVPLQPGMTYAIEPMLIIGRNALRELADHWTVVTVDGSWCAQYEHTVAVTEGDPLILTLP
ncbi:MAG: type I methionyl aminopeptidase [bacterium]|nr:type I methionyl aminopeptidase [bacterium]